MEEALLYMCVCVCVCVCARVRAPVAGETGKEISPYSTQCITL